LEQSRQDALATHVQSDGNPDKTQTRGHLDMNTGDPDGCRNNDVDSLANHDTADHWQKVSGIQEMCDTSESSSDIERYKHFIRVVFSFVEGVGHVGRKSIQLDIWLFFLEVNVPQETCNLEQNLKSSKDIVCLEPTQDQGNVGPDLPRHDKGNCKAKQLLAGWLCPDVLAIDVNDAD
jgi:hypothetical protein